MTLTRERAWEFFYYWRDCLRKYVARNAITISLLLLLAMATWIWILLVAVIF